MQESSKTATVLHWTENDKACSAYWRSEAGITPPKSVIVADDRLPADKAYRYACEGTAILWRGDFQNAKQLLQALMRRVNQKPKKNARKAGAKPDSMKALFHLNRQAKAQRAHTLAMLLIPLEADYSIHLRRAPDIKQACEEVYGPSTVASVVSLRELLSVIGAYEWRKAGVDIAALGERIYPHFGVFSPVRGEYIDLVAQVPLPLPSSALAFDIGTGTGVLAALLAKRGIAKIVATEQDARALICAQENFKRLGCAGHIQLLQADLFPAGRANLVICNPPWLPGRPSAPIEAAIYDPDSRMLRGFLSKLAEHLEIHGEGWLILSDFAEHLGLRSREELLAWIDEGNLRVIGKIDTRPKHGKATDSSDPLYAARSLEVTSLWRLARK